MDSHFYCAEIIKNTLVPFINEVFPDGHRFMQDNDPKNNSIKAREVVQEWHELKEKLRNDMKLHTKQELGICDILSKNYPEKCRRYIGHLKIVLPKVVERDGRASGY